jgi:YVTN family beta-propeller protein
VNTKTHKVTATIKPTGESVRPMGVVVSPDGQRVFVSTGRGGTVLAIDASKNTVVGSVKVGDRPWGIALSPDGKFLYSANGPSNDVSVVDVDTLTVVGKVTAGQRPWGVVIAPAPSSR